MRIHCELSEVDAAKEIAEELLRLSDRPLDYLSIHGPLGAQRCYSVGRGERIASMIVSDILVEDMVTSGLNPLLFMAAELAEEIDGLTESSS